MGTTRKVGAFVWIDLVGRSQEDEATLRDLGLSHLEIEDLLDTAVHPKAHAREGRLLMAFLGLDLDYAQERAEFELETIEVDVVLGPDWVLTHADRSLEAIRRIASLLDEDPQAFSRPCELLHRLLDTIVDEYEPFLEQFLPQRIDAIEDELFSERPGTTVRREIYLRRRDVIRLQRAAVPQATAMHALVRLAEHSTFARADAELFRDIAERLDRVASLSTSLRAELDSAFEHYLSAEANTQNEIMKVLTMVASILLPMTVVTGVYGMNFDFMPELREAWGYPAALLLNLVIGVAGLLFFRAKGWIGRGPARPPSPLEIPVLGQVLRLPAYGARLAGRQAVRLARWRRGRYDHAERRAAAPFVPPR